ncbi:hypothetical protein MJG53_004943 [Ovis ammon polii x Ovis aries]|uniref:Uncharacterized protein n=1 Tax=Ovis ammon polii x Ovis aries TaxID=2918886 RepID=A0ACB9VBP8_9CETA|nr:hypothetical protein MJT46_002972 [Ovis ammon polii x Ovis aries]KAI4587156.1 hypothetical protein MJG53_004943 [Ovis ammon polii x Ovis aries]
MNEAVLDLFLLTPSSIQTLTRDQVKTQRNYSTTVQNALFSSNSQLGSTCVAADLPHENKIIFHALFTSSVYEKLKKNECEVGKKFWKFSNCSCVEEKAEFVLREFGKILSASSQLSKK